MTDEIHDELHAKQHRTILAEAIRAERAGSNYLSLPCPECGRVRLEVVHVNEETAAKCEKCAWPYIETDDERERREGDGVCSEGCECVGCYLVSMGG